MPNNNKPTKTAELNTLRKEAEHNFPGITELLEVYGGYNEMMVEVQKYLNATQDEPLTTTSNRSQEV